MDFQAHLEQVERLVQERERDGRAARRHPVAHLRHGNRRSVGGADVG